MLVPTEGNKPWTSHCVESVGIWHSSTAVRTLNGRTDALTACSGVDTEFIFGVLSTAYERLIQEMKKANRSRFALDTPMYSIIVAQTLGACQVVNRFRPRIAHLPPAMFPSTLSVSGEFTGKRGGRGVSKSTYQQTI